MPLTAPGREEVHHHQARFGDLVELCNTNKIHLPVSNTFNPTTEAHHRQASSRKPLEVPPQGTQLVS